MTSTPPEAPPDGPGRSADDRRRTPGPRVTRDEVRDLGRLRRTSRGPQGRRRRRRPGPPPRHRPGDPAGGLRGAGVLRRRRPGAVRRVLAAGARGRPATAPRWPSTSAARGLALVLAGAFARAARCSATPGATGSGWAGRWSWSAWWRSWCWADVRRPRTAPAPARAGRPRRPPHRPRRRTRRTAPLRRRTRRAAPLPRPTTPPRRDPAYQPVPRARAAAGRSSSGSRWRWSPWSRALLGIVDLAGVTGRRRGVPRPGGRPPSARCCWSARSTAGPAG